MRLAATDLVRLVVDAVRRTGQKRHYTAGISTPASMRAIEHAGGKLPTKLPPSDRRDLAGVLCLIFCSHIDLLRLRFGLLLPSFWDGGRAGFRGGRVQRKVRPSLRRDYGMRFPARTPPLGKRDPF